jgi:hypothetical protein
VFDRSPFLPIGADARPVVVEFPGSSLMDITVVAAEQFVVRCPGCRASQLFSLPASGLIRPRFLHKSIECPIRRRIETALAIAEPVMGGAACR